MLRKVTHSSETNNGCEIREILPSILCLVLFAQPVRNKTPQRDEHKQINILRDSNDYKQVL